MLLQIPVDEELVDALMALAQSVKHHRSDQFLYDRVMVKERDLTKVLLAFSEAACD